MSALRLGAGVSAAIVAEARRAYPHEACGALLGPAPRHVSEARALPNVESDAPRRRFSVSPEDYLAVEDEAAARGLRLLGFWHSHPDAPARPSETDRRYAWEGLVTLVVAVAQGEPGELSAWEIAAPDAPFRRVPIADAPETAPRAGAELESNGQEA